MRARSPSFGKPASGPHLGADPRKVIAREHSPGEWEDHRFLDADVLAVKRTEGFDEPFQFGDLFGGKLAVAQRGRQEFIHASVQGIGAGMVAMQAVKIGKGFVVLPGVLIARQRGTHTREERVLFIGRMPWRGVDEIGLRLAEGLGVRRIERSPLDLLRHAEQNPQECLDAAVAVGEQAQRLVKVVVGSAAEDAQRCTHAEYYDPMAQDDSKQVSPPVTPPLKRHPSLQPLSREHMNGLIQARALQRASESDEAARRRIVAEFVKAWQTEVRPHFDDEERLLLPLVDSEGLRDRLLNEHTTLRRLAERCARDPMAAANDAELLRELGVRLHDHIRWEEREFFEAVQRDHPNALTGLSAEAAVIEHLRPGSRARHSLSEGGTRD